MNLILCTDSYKASHYLQYPPGMQSMHCYLESRGGEFEESCFFGLRPILEQLAAGVCVQDVDEAEAVLTAHGLPCDVAGWDRIVNHHSGRLPLCIRAVPEGSVWPVGTPLLTVESTDPELAWLPGYFETLIERVWYPTTVCTLSREIKKDIKVFLDQTSDNPKAELSFKLHDFGARGVSSGESAALGGAAHLVNFQGTDTLEGLMLARRVYGADMPGYSIPAMEHSTVTCWGRPWERDAYRNMLTRYAKPGAVVAMVMDSYNIWEGLAMLGGPLKQQIVDSGATVVVRPDSGDPYKMVPQVLSELGGYFGTTVNGKGYRVLDRNIRVIQGDGMNRTSIRALLNILEQQKWSITNVAFGCGGGLLQSVTRDTQKFAYKCSSITVDGEQRDVYKAPVTDLGKQSKRGIQNHVGLSTVFDNGILANRPTFEGIQERAALK